MMSFHSVVTEQREFICAVCAFIGDLVRAVLPDIAWDNALLPDEESIRRILDGVIERHAREGANEGDCRLAMAQVTCVKMKRVCDLLKRISESVGLADVAGKYLDAPWFIDLLFRRDTSKLNKLCYTIDLTDEKPSRLLMNIAAILEGRAAGYDAMSARAKRKADRETRDLIREVGKDVKSLHGKLDASKKEIVGEVKAAREELHETKEELLARADAMLKKLGNVNLGGKRNSTHAPEQKKTCWMIWNLAQENAELKSNTKTGKATRPAAFEWYKRQLALVGVTKLDKFVDVLNTLKTKKYADQKAALDAKREAERKAKKCGTIRGMKKTMRSMLATALSIFAVAAPCMASDASPDTFRGGVQLFAKAA